MIDDNILKDFKKIDNLKETLVKVVQYVRKKDAEQLHSLEKKIIEDAIVNNDQDFAELAVVTYCFRKMFFKQHIFTTNVWKDTQDEILYDLNNLTKYEFDLNKYRDTIKNAQSKIEYVDKQLGHFVENIVQSARTKLASTAYAYGLSSEQACSLFSTNREQLMSFVGNTKMPDEDKPFKTIKERVHLLKVMSKSEYL
jgi:hypothetical protein